MTDLAVSVSSAPRAGLAASMSSAPQAGLATGRAIARANIALAKYWGKSDVGLNLPAVPSLSLTLDGLETTTTVRFDSAMTADLFVLNGRAAPPQVTTAFVDLLRARAGTTLRAHIESTNNFPTASGLASSASGYAALVGATNAALGLGLSLDAMSAIARRGSASAARSVFGGFVELLRGEPGHDSLCATEVAPVSHWNVELVIAVTTELAKETSSRDGMTHTRETSPYYQAWLTHAYEEFKEVRAGVLGRDFKRTGEAMESSTLAMHACAMAARPGVIYWNGTTLTVFQKAKELRSNGLQTYATMDAGPHVKLLVHSQDAEPLAQEIAAIPGVVRVIRAKPGEGLVCERV